MKSLNVINYFTAIDLLLTGLETVHCEGKKIKVIKINIFSVMKKRKISNLK